MGDIEVLITSSSRPQLFPYCWNSFKKMCIIRDPYHVTVHEDFVFPDESNRVVKYLKLLRAKGDIHAINSDNPPIGLGYTLDKYINSIKSKYLFYLQEDWIFERPIDVDEVTWVMDTNPKINLIFFNKIRNNGVINKQEQREFTYSGMRMCCYHGWTFLPGIWRMDFVRKHWVPIYNRPEGHFTNLFGSHAKRTSVEYCVDNIGAYIYGPTGEPRYVRHIGNNWRMASWRLENDGKGHKRPSGRHDAKSMDLDYMAPWVPYPKYPVYGEDYDTEEIERLLRLQEEK